MNKLQFLNDQLDGKYVTLIEMKILFVLFKKSFLTCKEIVDEIDTDVDEYEVLESLTKLKDEYGLVDKSSLMFLLTTYGDEVVEKSATAWFEHEFPDAKPANGGRFKRPIGKTMDDFKDQIYDELGDAMRDFTISRQNYKIKFHNHKSGFKWLEVRNCGNLRVVIGKSRKDLVDDMLKFDGVVPIKTTDLSYILKYDLPLDAETISKVTNYIKPHLN